MKNKHQGRRELHRENERLPNEAGLKLIRQPREVREMPVTAFLRNPLGISDWKPFLSK